MTDEKVEQIIREALEQAAKQANRRMEAAARQAEKRDKQLAKEADKRAWEAAERAAGVYHEKTKHELQIVMEAFGDIQKKTDKIPIIEEKIDILTKDMQVVKGVLKDTSKDLQNHGKRIGKLESAVFHA